MITAVCWKWGNLFEPAYVNRLRAALERHLHLQHILYCVTDNPAGIDPRVAVVPIPEGLDHTPRCRRRMRIFSREFAERLGKRILSIDLDVVLVDDITPIVDRPEPFVGWKVGYAGVLSGSFHLMNAGVLDGLWQKFAADPEGYPRSVSRERVPSDQAMLNAWLWGGREKRLGYPPPFWTEADGFVTYFGKGYEHLEKCGVGPHHTSLPAGARIVVLGSADLADLESGSAPWIREHWTALPGESA